MHIEPGIVQGAKLLLGFGTALTAGGLVLRQCQEFLVQYGLSTLLAGQSAPVFWYSLSLRFSHHHQLESQKST